MCGPWAEKSNSTVAIECYFINWMSGYVVYMGVVLLVISKHGWHLVTHMSNVWKACTTANETVAIEYDEAFPKGASYSEVAW